MSTHLTVAIEDISAVWLGSQPGHHGWRLAVTLKSGSTQVVVFDTKEDAEGAFAAVSANVEKRGAPVFTMVSP